MSTWRDLRRDKGTELILLAYILTWAAVLYVSYRMMT
jgi:hypothetical protein